MFHQAPVKSIMCVVYSVKQEESVSCRHEGVTGSQNKHTF